MCAGCRVANTKYRNNMRKNVRSVRDPPEYFGYNFVMFTRAQRKGGEGEGRGKGRGGRRGRGRKSAMVRSRGEG
jgi:hypothetical protein